jgi:hypothetical protein
MFSLVDFGVVARRLKSCTAGKGITESELAALSAVATISLQYVKRAPVGVQERKMK